MSGFILNRRKLLGFGAVAASSLALSGCDAFDFLSDTDSKTRGFLQKANDLTYHVQRSVIRDGALAREYAPSEIRQGQRPNGSTDPQTDEYLSLQANQFRDFRLAFTGLFDRPARYSLDELRNMPSRTQITRHDCVEGWSCIAKWTGVPLRQVLDEIGVKSQARYLLFHCYDDMGGGLSGPQLYYESCDLVDARHPQTLLAYGLNDQVLPVANGAPLRVRIERALGYKQPKYVHTIEAVESFADFSGGKGGFWEDNYGYDWYGGI